MTGLLATLRLTALALERLQRPWALIGGLAISVRTEPRFTRDIDIAVAVAGDADAEAAVSALVAQGYRASALVEQQAGDIRSLLGVMEANAVAAARDACQLITSRGYGRDRDLAAALDAAVREFGAS